MRIDFARINVLLNLNLRSSFWVEDMYSIAKGQTITKVKTEV